MNQEFINLLAKHSDDVAAFLEGTAEIRAVVRGKPEPSMNSSTDKTIHAYW